MDSVTDTCRMDKRSKRYHSDKIVPTADASGKIVHDVMKIYHGRRTSSVYKKHAFTISMFRSTMKIVVNANGADGFLTTEMPGILELIEQNKLSIKSMNETFKNLLSVVPNSVPPMDRPTSSAMPQGLLALPAPHEEIKPDHLKESVSTHIDDSFISAIPMSVFETPNPDGVVHPDNVEDSVEVVRDGGLVDTVEDTIMESEPSLIHATTASDDVASIIPVDGVTYSLVDDPITDTGSDEQIIPQVDVPVNHSQLTLDVHSFDSRLVAILDKNAETADNMHKMFMENNIMDKLDRLLSVNEKVNKVDQLFSSDNLGLILKKLEKLENTQENVNKEHNVKFDEVFEKLEHVVLEQKIIIQQNNNKIVEKHDEMRQEVKPATSGCMDYYMVRGPHDPLSNLFEVKVPHKVNNKYIEGKSLEHSYQYNKAVVITGSDQGISREILNAKTAVTAKYLGDRLNKHDN